MPKLTDDCFRFGAGPTPLDTAIARIQANLAPIAGTESVTLQQAPNRITAADIIAPRSVPPHDNAAVDGYLVRYSDLNTHAPTILPLAGRITAGHPLADQIPPGSAARVLTGAPLVTSVGGDDPDTIFMQEDCDDLGDRVVLPPGVRQGANYRRCAEDVTAGTTSIDAGTRLKPPDIGVIASLGIERITVRQQLRVAILSTGDELRNPGDDTPPGTVFDANRFCLAAWAEALGIRVVDCGIVRDRPDCLCEAMSRAADSADVIITSGGMSSGDEDHVKAAVLALGGSLDFWRLAIKPGRPVAAGHVEGRFFLGLPGNPVAGAITFLMVARPILLTLAGGNRRTTAPPWVQTPLGFEYQKKPGHTEFVRVRHADDQPGGRLLRFEKDGSGILTSLSWADGLVKLDESVERIGIGDSAPYCSLAALL